MNEGIFLTFHGKVLLFGEYTVILGYEALALPIQNFSGKLKLMASNQEANISPFIQYLGALHHIDINQDLLEELELEKLIFESNIPIGYGAGSSGALTAAVYDAFVINKKSDLNLLKEELASMEDYFHGSSSGLDPIVAYTKDAIHINADGFHRLSISKNIKNSLSHFYLVDTGIARSTGQLVEVFKKKIDDEYFLENIKSDLTPHNEKAVQSFLEADAEVLKNEMNAISLFQFTNMKEMIPSTYRSLWENTLESPEISLKLCGAGGGGFILAFSLDEDFVQKWRDENNLKLIRMEIS